MSVLNKIGVNVKDVIIAVNKGDCAKKISEEFEIKIKSLVDIDVVNGKIEIKS